MPEAVKKILYLILTFFIGLFVVSSFFVRAEYNYAAYNDNPMLSTQKPLLFIGLLVVLAFAALMLHRLCRRLNRYRARIVIPSVLAGSFAIQIALIFLFPRLPTDDSQTVLSLALDMLYRGDYSTFEPGGYLHMFPFNFSVVLYLKSLLAIFPDNYLVIKIFNILFAVLTTLMVHLIYGELRGYQAGNAAKGNDYGPLLFAATYAPALLMSNLIYNDVVGTGLLTSAIYFILRFMRTKSFKFIAFAAVLLALGNYFRGVGVIVLIAAAITILLGIRRIGVRKSLLSIALLAALFNVPSWTQNAALQASGKVESSVTANSAPVYMWLNMGINLDRIGFWDNMQSYRIYQREADYDKAASTELYKQSIREKLSDASPGELLGMYVKKIVWIWTEGTYQIDRYGIGNGSSSEGGFGGSTISGSYSYTTWATDLFEGDSAARGGLLWVLYTMNILMYACIGLRLFLGIQAKRYGEVFPVLILLGFIGFYILWEIKSRYLYPVYPLLIVLSYLGFRDGLVLLAKTSLGRRLLPETEKEELHHAQKSGI
ncbi:glycosyltransferase family 39 protein [Saccharibacillus sp. CPCC 101409]|uniref:glycosyltransferase family 39 protein n=1 Tax=Saccharibacillus sp. CPCC 101409 TaxID=3058041 RepID=UPI00267126AC|nr:glycosyltransferase family 39 protein [Saccharibacillus sp. CPCC 101409]MDO3413031.1 glycosyltransferase family 39 protein [Saccharibacillus sp. CPCC 101409]